MCLILLRIKGYHIVFVSLVRDTCAIRIFLSIVPTSFISEAYWFRNISFTCSGNKWNIILRNKSLLYNFPFLGILKLKISFTCFCYKLCFKHSFGSRDIKLYCSHFFHLGGILIPKYLFHLIGEQVKQYSSK